MGRIPEQLFLFSFVFVPCVTQLTIHVQPRKGVKVFRKTVFQKIQICEIPSEIDVSRSSFVQILSMRPILIFLLLAGAGIIGWLIFACPGKKEPDVKQEAIAVSKHSSEFNNSVAVALNDYNKLTERFVAWDSTSTPAIAQQLINDLNGLKLDELKKDSSAIYETALAFVDNAKGDAQTITTEKGIRAQREALNSLSDNFYQLLNTVKYDGKKLFLQQCPMAFDDTKPGLWLSQQEEIRNPYLGLHHPTYGKAMLSCGETKIKMNNTGAE